VILGLGVLLVVISLAIVVLPTLRNMFAPGIGSTMISDKDDMILVYVPAGEFTMGSDSGEAHEKPVHMVSLDAFWIDQTEVTNAMYAKCVQDGACSQPDDTSIYSDSNYANHPVVYVSWNNAKAYCEWADRRLPTEAEWEKAARGENAFTYPWGNDAPNNNLLNYNIAVGDRTDVGKYPDGASPYGALDMAGNVWEWVADWFDANYYATLGEIARNPQGPISGQDRVVRGGSWYDGDYYVRSALRSRNDPAYSDSGIGLRCSRSP
ncbi:MAG TPA: formylglycine-generating enzyme family protein, partial [Anaerolineales bacterium]|nr:formylglycine-generating enzyme family protein [Anaerolineales bacterium]